MVDSSPDNFEADPTPPPIARMFGLPVATVWPVLQFNRESRAAGDSGGGQFPERRRAGAISVMPIFSESAELALLARRADARSIGIRAISNFGRSGAGRALRYAGAPRPPAVRPQPPRSDIAKWHKE